jgi:threonine/homoserine/homoserine lactone efflux protein
MFTAPLFGFIFGFFGSVPVAGPVAILVFSRGLEERARSARYLATGAAISESVYAYLAFWGFSELLDLYPWVEPLTRGAAAVILFGLGAHFLLRRRGEEDTPGPPDPSVGNKRSFFLGMTITALNPTLIATWTAAVTLLHSLDIVLFRASQALPFSLGVFAGIVAWFYLVLVLLARFKDRLKRGTIDKVVRVLGGALMLLGLVFAVHFVLALGEIL